MNGMPRRVSYQANLGYAAAALVVGVTLIVSRRCQVTFGHLRLKHRFTLWRNAVYK